MRYQQISVAFTWSLFVTTPIVKTSAFLLHRISGVSSSSTRRASLHTSKIVLGFSHRQTISTMSGRGEYYKNKYGGGGRGGGRGRGGGGGGSGRGEYYKNKYGGGGRGGGRGGRGGDNQGNNDSNNNYTAQGGGSYVDLQNCLRRLDGKSYGAYHDLDTPEDRGWMNTQAGYTLFVGRAQSDPFSPPTRCRVIVNAATAGFPKESYSNRVRAMATSDFLLRTLYEICKQQGADASLGGQGWSGPKGGDIQVLQPGQHVLEQSAVRIDTKTGNVIAQITINLPARGRTILGQAAETILMQTFPTLVQRALLFRSLNSAALKSHVFSIEDQCWLQSQLESRNLVAFVRNGAILPRYSGVDDRPMETSKAIPFESPKRLEVSFDLPNAGKTISGMGIPKGITLICGGGFHGKSTLLESLQVGIYPKIPGDGREYCAMSQNASKIRAEDGRNVQSVDISAFINNLPFGKDTSNFSTPDASGSTSQATNILEAVEIGADTLLVDEDTCATNFMVRDSKMIQLVAPDKEPITPFVRVIRSLYDEFGISSVLVIGGVGDFFRQSDNVLVMDCYKCLDATERAKQIVAAAADEKEEVVPDKPFHKGPSRIVKSSAISPNGKVKVLSQSSISYGETELDISSLEQLVAKAQTAAISNALQRYGDFSSRDGLPMKDVLTEMDKRIDTDGLDILSPGQFHGGMSRPRMLEVAGALNRLRRQSIAQLR